MKSKSFRVIATTFQVFFISAFLPAQASSMSPLSYEGCFWSLTGMHDLGPYFYQGPDLCQQQCINLNKPLMAISQRSYCWCGDSDSVLGPSVLAPDGECDSACTDYIYNIHSYMLQQYQQPVCDANCLRGGGPDISAMWYTGPKHSMNSDNSSSRTILILDGYILLNSADQDSAGQVGHTCGSSLQTQLPSAGLLCTWTMVIISVVFPIMFLLSVLHFRRYQRRLSLETAAIEAVRCDSNDQSHDISGNAQLYLQQKAELDAVEHQRLDMKADDVRLEMHGAPLVELPAEENTFGRQELRGPEHSKELEAP